MFRDRHHAGRQLAHLLAARLDREDVVVLALPRGGVPVGFEIAEALDAPFDVFLVRKLGVPGFEELAMGAIASGGVRVLNDAVVDQYGVTPAAFAGVLEREQAELQRRERVYRGEHPEVPVQGRTVVLVDDGLATGATMRAAITALRRQRPKAIVVAVPVAAAGVYRALCGEVDEVVCLAVPERFVGVGEWYVDFEQTSDSDVRALLAQARRQHAADDAGDASGEAVVKVVRRHALPLGAPEDLRPLLDRIGDAGIVLLGEATHGSREFYRLRADITRHLIVERGFALVAIEADWPDARRVDRYVRGFGTDADADAALAGFRRFPAWMWRNTEVRDFVTWLRACNDDITEPAARVGFYGLDLYSLHASIAAVLDYLGRTDPDAARRARHRYACFDRFGGDLHGYDHAVGLGLTASCEREAVAQLVDLYRHAMHDDEGDEERFDAEQNARLVRSAEAYYRHMLRSGVEAWNLRDRHMLETLEALIERRTRHGRPAKVVVWAHNSHLGDARATALHELGELNLGQLVRERYGAHAVAVGFTTYTGRVTAATDWETPARTRQIRPALRGSYEALLHATGLGRFQLRLDEPALTDVLRRPRLERAIGVIYRPETERESHYFRACLPRQFDWLLHVDETEAVIPFDRDAGRDEDEPAGTSPSGL